MEQTLEMMKNILLGNEGDKPLKELIEEYKVNKSPNILAYIYVSNYGVIKNLSKLYPNLDNADKASFCIQILDKALLDYDLKTETKFMTYFMQCFRRKLKLENILLNSGNKKLMFKTSSLEVYLEKEDTYDFNYFSFDEFARENNLTEIENKYCKLVYAGYKPVEINKFFGHSKISGNFYRNIYNIRKKVVKAVQNTI